MFVAEERVMCLGSVTPGEIDFEPVFTSNILSAALCIRANVILCLKCWTKAEETKVRITTLLGNLGPLTISRPNLHHRVTVRLKWKRKSQPQLPGGRIR